MIDFVELGDICETTQGVQITKSNTSDTPYDGGYRYLYIADFVDERSLSFVDDIYDRKKVTDNDLVMANTGSPGRVFKGQDGILSNNLFKISFDTTEISRDYLYQILSSDIFQSSLQKQMKGGIQKHLGHKTIARQKISLPPLAQQKRIAGILDAADKLRAKRRESIAQLDTLLQSTFLDMFGDPVTNPMGWENRTMGDSCDILTGFAFPSRKYINANSGIALCRGINVSLGQTNWKDRVDWQLPYDDKLTRYEVLEGDILLAMDRPWISGGLKIAVAKSSDLPALLVQRVARIRANSSTEQCLVYALIKSELFLRHCNPTETTVPHISPKDLQSFPIIQPPREEINRFSMATELINEQKALQEKHLVVLNNLFASLQQRAFNGTL